MTATYVPGKGYTIRDARGRVLAHSQTVAQRDLWLQCADCAVITEAMLTVLRAG